MPWTFHDNVAFGPIVGLDEHTVDPDAGFDWHGHRGVAVVSWILEGTLRHQDSDGAERLVGPGALLVQHTGDGIRHRETNASATGTLRFVQITVLDDEPNGVAITEVPATVAGVLIDVGPTDTSDDARTLVRDLGDGTALVLAPTTPA